MKMKLSDATRELAKAVVNCVNVANATTFLNAWELEKSKGNIVGYVKERMSEDIGATLRRDGFINYAERERSPKPEEIMTAGYSPGLEVSARVYVIKESEYLLLRHLANQIMKATEPETATYEPV